VFFVLSGYLITTLLLAEHDRSDTIRLREFWGRRARRLLPALLVVLVVAAVAMAFTAVPDERIRFRGDALATLAYVANWRFITTAQGYFDSFGSPSMLRHTWSLAIEEQWYLAWPVIVAGVLRLTPSRNGGPRGHRTLFALTILGAGASALTMARLAGGGVDPSRAYYGTDARAQGLLVGAALAIALPRLRASRGFAVAAPALGGFALAAIVAAFVLVHDDDAWMYRGGFLAVSVAAAIAVGAAAGPPDVWFRRLLGCRPAAAIGTVSYGLYLWHWPVDLFLSPARVGFGGTALFAVRVVCTTLFAVASFTAVEQPLRQRRVAPRGRIPALVATAAAAIVLAAVPAAGVVAAPRKAGAPTTRLPASLRAAVEAAKGQRPPDFSLLLVGDSVAWNLGWALAPDDIAAAERLEFRAHIGCGVASGVPLDHGRPLPFRVDCGGALDEWRAGMSASHPQVALVVAGAWEVLDREVDGARLVVGTPTWRALLRRDVDRHLEVLLGQPQTRVLLATVPCYAGTSLEVGGQRPSDRADPTRARAVNAIFADAVAAVPAGRASIVDLGAFLCPRGVPRRDPRGIALRDPDGIHLTPAGAHAAWRWLDPLIRAAAT